MTIIDAIVQGIVQGLTEFLPVSSSGHLAITQHIMGTGGESNLFFNVMLHVGTLVAVVAFYYKLIWSLIKEFVLMVKDIFTGKFKWSEMNYERNMIMMLMIGLLPLFVMFIPIPGTDMKIKDLADVFSSSGILIVTAVSLLITSALLFVGIMTDTGNLSWSSSYPEVYEIMAQLMRYGIDKPNLYKQAMDTVPLNSLKLHSYALLNKMTIIDDSIALITLDHNDLETFSYKTGDTERLVNRPLAVKEVYWSTFMREDPNYIKVSMRSEGDFAVDVLCSRYFNGGGHMHAAAGEFYGTMQEAVELYYKIVEEIKQNKQ